MYFTDKVNSPLLEWFVHVNRDHGQKCQLLSFSKFLTLLTGSYLGKNISKKIGPIETSLQDFVSSGPLAVMTPTDSFMKFSYNTLYLILCETQE